MADYFETQSLIERFDSSFADTVTRKSLLLVGLGGNGTHLALAAVRMGFAEVVGVDCDFVSPSNLSRQVLYNRSDLGQRKADVARRVLEAHNLRSTIQTHDLNILNERRRFGSLVSKSDLVFLIVDQPYTSFFAADTCQRLRRPAILGGTCVLSGTTTRISWMDGVSSPCLNCANRIANHSREWGEYYRFDDSERLQKSDVVNNIDNKISLDGGHASFYPTACIGSNMMLCLGIDILMGRRDMPRSLAYSVLRFKLETSSLTSNPNCLTCGTGS
jgi:molybdopterin/thiamine biosynthesis adenylyltransferase